MTASGRFFYLALALIGVPMTATLTSAQSPAARATTPSPEASAAAAMPRGDIGGAIGWFNQRAGAEACCDWYGSFWAGVEGGYYWTEHLKTEVGFANTTQGRLWTGSQSVTVGGRTYWESGEDFVRTRRLSVAQLYQFGHNAWVHPFVGAGVHVAREVRHGTRFRYPATYPGGGEKVALPQTSETRVRGSGLAGLKIYMTRRAYFRTDMLLGFGDAVEEVTMRFGFGVDF